MPSLPPWFPHDEDWATGVAEVCLLPHAVVAWLPLLLPWFPQDPADEATPAAGVDSQLPQEAADSCFWVARTEVAKARSAIELLTMVVVGFSASERMCKKLDRE